MNNEETFLPENLRVVIAYKKLTYQKLAKETGVCPQTVMNWTSGRSTPRYRKVLRLSRYLNVDVSFFSKKLNF